MMGLTIFPDLVQGTEEWRAARCGIVTASEVGKLLTSTLQVADNETSRGLALTLTAERITGHVEPGPMSSDMWRGIDDEPRAREVYAAHYAPVDELGLMVRDDWGFAIGYSPDGTVGDDGLIECKSRLPKKHLQAIVDDRVPPENMAQLQCALLVSGRAWIDYVSFCGGMPLWVKRVLPNPTWFVAIATAAAAFEERAAELTERYLQAVAGLPLTERSTDYADIEV